jgi:catechol 2,3-dioxygenase-like lactoylglutathione lyase family enzyme
MGRLDHVHVRVPDRAVAAAWYSKHLGFDPVGEFDFWASGIDGGPLQISADGGATTLALFEVRGAQPIVPQHVAFSVDADAFISFARSLPGEILGLDGALLQADDVVDYDLCYAYDLADPWGHQYELNCYDRGRVVHELIEVDSITPVRKWPDDLHGRYLERE